MRRSIGTLRKDGNDHHVVGKTIPNVRGDDQSRTGLVWIVWLARDVN